MVGLMAALPPAPFASAIHATPVTGGKMAVKD